MLKLLPTEMRKESKNLGVLSLEGRGDKMEMAEAIRLFMEAVSKDYYMELGGQKIPNLGVEEAEHSLGLCYEEGTGVPQSYQTSIYWYMRAIKHGSASSANNMGCMYLTGRGVERNFSMTIAFW
jgi:TPR repeat protein